MEGEGVREAWAVCRKYGDGRGESDGACDVTDLWGFWSGRQRFRAHGGTW